MKLSSLLIIFVMLAGMAFGDNQKDLDYLESYLSRQIIEEHQLDPEYIKITLVRNGLQTSDPGNYIIRAYPQVVGVPGGRYPMLIELYRDGAVVEKGTVSLDVRIFADLLVPLENIKRHDILDQAMFEYKRFDITSQTTQYLDSPKLLKSRRATQNLKAGRKVPIRRIESIPDIKRDERITIITGGELFQIKASGKALQSGSIGDQIKVKNTDSNKILTGTIAGPGVVEITI